MIHLMSNEEKIIKRLRNSAMSYLARYEVSIHQFENTMKRKLSNCLLYTSDAADE